MTLVLDKISFAYSPVTSILNDISFSVSAKETICILGASGCGKSTLLRIIAGLLPNSELNEITGHVMYNSQSIQELKEEGTLGFMFQEPALLPYLTVSENIQFPLKMLGKSFSGDIDNLIQSVGLSDAKSKLPKDLSGGMKTRTALARSFITKPKLLLLDEPFSALDKGWKSTLYTELNNLQSIYNTCVVMVTHDIDEALDLGTSILLLSHSGNTLGHFTPAPANKSNMRGEIMHSIIQDHNSYITKLA